MHKINIWTATTTNWLKLVLAVLFYIERHIVWDLFPIERKREAEAVHLKQQILTIFAKLLKTLLSLGPKNEM